MTKVNLASTVTRDNMKERIRIAFRNVTPLILRNVRKPDKKVYRVEWETF